MEGTRVHSRTCNIIHWNLASFPKRILGFVTGYDHFLVNSSKPTFHKHSHFTFYTKSTLRLMQKCCATYKQTAHYRSCGVCIEGYGISFILSQYAIRYISSCTSRTFRQLLEQEKTESTCGYMDLLRNKSCGFRRHICLFAVILQNNLKKSRITTKWNF
jgi:hypothetical protein